MKDPVGMPAVDLGVASFSEANLAVDLPAHLSHMFEKLFYVEEVV